MQKVKIEGAREMPMVFRNEKSRKQLLEKGVVYTFRRKPRVVGKDWATDKRGGKKIADIFISLVGYLPMKNLDLYVSQSGFASLDEWIAAIKELNPKIGTHGWLYRVERGGNEMRMLETERWSPPAGLLPESYKPREVLKPGTEVRIGNEVGTIVKIGAPGNASAHYLVFIVSREPEWFPYWEVEVRREAR